ncbi:hypothetical protein KVT40_007522 [Elsinoe batatas]|uniref:Uncharacterized protein n=1 Tax=Elsinoe batatas TaxID=2601811 RepID=A0A8K0KWA4_9PEZI|nr:hypothetical protein KVT40_007522 [Elsinoe batatas]
MWDSFGKGGRSHRALLANTDACRHQIIHPVSMPASTRTTNPVNDPFPSHRHHHQVYPINEPPPRPTARPIPPPTQPHRLSPIQSQHDSPTTPHPAPHRPQLRPFAPTRPLDVHHTPSPIPPSPVHRALPGLHPHLQPRESLPPSCALHRRLQQREARESSAHD